MAMNKYQNKEVKQSVNKLIGYSVPNIAQK
jgi:hypothetical protein